jgi:FixJ family two-component response regulator
VLATGERARKRTVRTPEDLAAREAQVARLAHDGLPNPEVGARLFSSPRTVEYHVRRSGLIGDLTPGGSHPGWRSVDKRLALGCA